MKQTSMSGILRLSEDGKVVEEVLDKSIIELSIPEGVEKIGSKVLIQCPHLQKLILPSTLTAIINIDECSSLRQYIVSQDNKIFTTIDGVLYNKDKTKLLAVPKSLQSTCFEIPNGVLEFNNSFRGCSAISKVVIPESVQEIGGFHDYPFWESSIQEIVIPKSLTTISKGAFVGCDNLKKIIVDEENPVYSSVDGILLDKEHTKIICFPRGKENTRLVVPDGVKELKKNLVIRPNKLRIVEIPGSISVIPEVFFKGCKNLQSVHISEGVTEIGPSAFASCHSLREIHIPSSVKTISQDAFNYCSSLEKLSLAEGVEIIGNEAFSSCHSLKTVMMANSVKKMGDGAFSMCESIEYIKLPQSLDHISDFLFYMCNSLKSVDIPQHVSRIGDWAFYGCKSLKDLSLPRGLKSISGCVFSGCEFVEVKIPDSVEEVSISAFTGCGALSHIDVDVNNKTYASLDGILYTKKHTKLLFVPRGADFVEYSVPESVTEISKEAFEGIAMLEQINLPEGLSSIEDRAFRDCKSLKSIKIPANVSSIGEDVFEGCDLLDNIVVDSMNQNFCSIDGILFSKDMTKLICVPSGKRIEHFVVPESVKEITNGAFAHNTTLIDVEFPCHLGIIGRGAFDGCTSLNTIDIPNSVESIGSRAFGNCTSLKNVEIPNSISEIEGGTFHNCKALINIDIPNSVNIIGFEAFKGCSSLTCVDIPDSVDDIEIGAFEDCSSLKEFQIPRKIRTINSYVFNGCDSLRQIDISSNISEIGKMAFRKSGLKEVRLSSCIDNIGDHAFCYAPIERYCVDQNNIYYFSSDDVLYKWINKETQEWCKLLKYPQAKTAKSFIADPKTLWIGECAFKGAEYLEEIALHDDINSIGEQAFSRCRSLKSMKLPESLVYVNERVFANCYSLEEVYLTSIERIYAEAFSQCTMLKAIHLYYEDADEMSVAWNAFDGVDKESCVLYVPSGSRWSYKHHRVFSQFKQIVVERMSTEQALRGA